MPYRWKIYNNSTHLRRLKAAETEIEIGKDWIAVTGRGSLVTKEGGLQDTICTKEDQTVDLKYVTFCKIRAVWGDYVVSSTEDCKYRGQFSYRLQASANR